jgi:hypothetical protein
MHRLTSTAVAASLFLAGLATAAPVLAQAPAKVRLTIPVTALSMTPVYLAQARVLHRGGPEVTDHDRR